MLDPPYRKGALSEEALVTSSAVNAALVALDKEFAEQYPIPGPIAALTDEGLRADPRWDTIRQLAGHALEALAEMDITIPNLLDDDYNIRRKDAP